MRWIHKVPAGKKTKRTQRENRASKKRYASDRIYWLPHSLVLSPLRILSALALTPRLILHVQQRQLDGCVGPINRISGMSTSNEGVCKAWLIRLCDYCPPWPLPTLCDYSLHVRYMSTGWKKTPPVCYYKFVCDRRRCFFHPLACVLVGQSGRRWAVLRISCRKLHRLYHSCFTVSLWLAYRFLLLLFFAAGCCNIPGAICYPVSRYM